MPSIPKPTGPAWRTPSDTPVIADREVHIWRADLRVPRDRVDEFATLLSQSENEQAGRFRFPQDGQDFIARTAILRRILALYLCADPRELDIRRTGYGKPYLWRTEAPGPLFFNLSSSDGLALFGICLNNKIGVDIERIRPLPGYEEVMVEYCSQNELAAFRELPAEQQENVFFRSWVCKEALAKALGTGLRAPLAEIEVRIDPSVEASLAQMPGEPREAAKWSLLEIPIHSGYRAALAIKRRAPSVMCWQWLWSRL